MERGGQERTGKEATIEEKIRIRKKEKDKERGTIRRRTERGQPAKMKRRIQEDEDQGDLNITININDEEGRKRQLPAVTPHKRKVGEGGEKDQRNPKRLKRSDLEGYITYKKWRMEDERQPVVTSGDRAQGDMQQLKGAEVNHHHHQPHPLPQEVQQQAQIKLYPQHAFKGISRWDLSRDS